MLCDVETTDLSVYQHAEMLPGHLSFGKKPSLLEPKPLPENAKQNPIPYVSDLS